MIIKKIIEKTVNIDTSKYEDYELLSAFTEQAKREAWTEEEIDAVVKRAIDNDFEYFIEIISIHCTSTEY